MLFRDKRIWHRSSSPPLWAEYTTNTHTDTASVKHIRAKGQVISSYCSLELVRVLSGFDLASPLDEALLAYSPPLLYSTRCPVSPRAGCYPCYISCSHAEWHRTNTHSAKLRGGLDSYMCMPILPDRCGVV